VLRLALDLLLFLFVAITLGGIGFVRRIRERDLGVEHRRLDALGLIVTPLIGGFDLTNHRFVGAVAGKQSSNRSKHRENGSAERDP